MNEVKTKNLEQDVIQESVQDPFEPFELGFEVPRGTKILSREPYVKELYMLMEGYLDNIILPKVGDVVEGKISMVSEEYAMVDIHSKEHGRIDLKKEDPGYVDYLQLGETITCVVKSATETGRDSGIVLSFTDHVNNEKFNEILESVDQSTAFAAVVEDMIQDAGYWISIDGIKAFLPGSLAGMNKIINFDSMLGKTIYVMPISYSKEKSSLVVSHKKYLELSVLPEEYEKLKDSPREILKGTVTGTTSFGVFAEWGQCLTGMIYKSDLSDEYKNMFRDRKIKPGDEIEFKVKDMINEKKIILTQRYDEYDPWLDIKEKYKEGRIYEGTVAKVKDYGAFIELEPGLKGLLLIQKTEDFEKFKKGDTVKVRLTKIDRESRKIFFGFTWKKRRPKNEKH